MARKKSQRSLELFYFFLDAAKQTNGSVRAFTLSPSGVTPEEVSSLEAGKFEVLPNPGPINILDLIPLVDLRAASWRFLVSDLLFPAEPEKVLSMLCRQLGRVVLVVPFDPSESEPDWSGHLQFVDCETGELRRRIVDKAFVEAYRAAYVRHSELWSDACRVFDVPILRISSRGALETVLREEALQQEVLRI